MRVSESMFQNPVLLERIQQATVSLCAEASTLPDSDARFKWEWIKWKLGMVIRKIEASYRKSIKEAEGNLQKWIQEEENKPVPSPETLNRLQNKLRVINEDKLQELILKARVKWADNNEKCTKFFFNRIKQNAAEANVIELKENGRDLNQQEINQKIFSYYKDLFKGKEVHIEEKWKPPASIKIPDASKNRLAAPFTHEELASVLFKKMHHGKSPGNDGLTVTVYKKLWPIIGNFVTASIQEGLEHGELSNSQKQSIIRLIRKKDKDPSLITNWCPISLMNVDAKILAKGL